MQGCHRLTLVLLAVGVVQGFIPQLQTRATVERPLSTDGSIKCPQNQHQQAVQHIFAKLALAILPVSLIGGLGSGAFAADSTQFKIEKGAASTLDAGSRKIITRGVTLIDADFHGKDLSGVSFQQSIVRNGNFKGTKLRSSSFFDADLTGADFEGADMAQVNLELTNLRDANLKNAILTEAYIGGATRLTDVKIDGADFTDTLLRKDQLQYLCARATGTNPDTGVSTADSLGCP